MNTTPVSASLLRLCAGLSRISVRHGSHLARYKQPRPELAGFEPGHGEKIWVFNHITTNQIVYSTKPQLDSNKALKQLPFNGKKTKPAKLRKDYWRPMAIIRFELGEGDIGRSVYQKLREFKRLHELSWGYQAEELYRMSKKDRGQALNNQKANSVADIAAVLAGAGRGNLMWRKPAGEQAEGTATEQQKQQPPAGEQAKETAAEQQQQQQPPAGEQAEEAAMERLLPAVDGEQGAAAARKPAPPFPGAILAPARVYWATEEDAAFALAWSPNVGHKVGLILDPVPVDEFTEIEEESPEPSTDESAAQSQENSRAA
ncbi:hypothetical protein GGTG_09468 [Gaeumannomyces tritici R3-111a-1]|uniref:Large ribosomal subunit protein mL67 n=1 Tax=Gaeumannomyces tritici (strain R3-111a-1) TaxID=644352 RepID=J3P7H7_GAET3|nr:hypothetical protein GGTG_09468 [Gaeumannomyces tritici R3-111a-1]EJT72608.1 hypothetical protein GGTG_09468 [Gaeumannomyces tritici R3-111a-1]